MFETVEHSADLCVVGGGLAGVAAAVEAARSGLRVTLMQDRPVLGGNASSEIRMWVCGAHGKNNRETGLLEELMLENQYRNREKNYAVWDSVIYGLVRGEPNIELLLNCSCLHCGMDGSRIVTAVLPANLYYKIMQYERYIILAVFLILFLGWLDGPLAFLRSAVFHFLDTITAFLG